MWKYIEYVNAGELNIIYFNYFEENHGVPYVVLYLCKMVKVPKFEEI